MGNLTSKAISDAFYKAGMKPIKVKKLSLRERAGEIRKFNLDFYNSLSNLYSCDCCHSFKKSEIPYFIRAYEIMSNKQIVASYEREYELDSKERMQFLKNYQEAQEEFKNRKFTGDEIRAGSSRIVMNRDKVIFKLSEHEKALLENLMRSFRDDMIDMTPYKKILIHNN